MRIAFFGSSLLSAYWNGAATYYRGLIRALHGRGHRVTFYEPDAYGRQGHRDLEPPDWAEVVVYPAEPGTVGVERALARARGADVVVKASGVGVHDLFLERAVLDLRGEGTAVVFWDVDAPATLDRCHHDPADPFRPLIPRYDAILTYGGGEPVVRAYVGLGARRCVPIYNALDPSDAPPRCRRGSTSRLRPRCSSPTACPTARRGWTSSSCAPPRRWARAASCWEGAAGRQGALPANVRALGHVYTADHNALNCSALAVLNVSRDSMVAQRLLARHPGVRGGRGRGVPDHRRLGAGSRSSSSPDVEILVARDGVEVAAHVGALAPGAGAGHRRGGAADGSSPQHTYARRAEQVEALRGRRASSVPR